MTPSPVWALLQLQFIKSGLPRNERVLGVILRAHVLSGVGLEAHLDLRKCRDPTPGLAVSLVRLQYHRAALAVEPDNTDCSSVSW